MRSVRFTSSIATAVAVVSILPLAASAQPAATVEAPRAAAAPAAPATPPASADPRETVTPAPRPGAWMQRHETINGRAVPGEVDVIFLGDSITQGWEGAGKQAWAEHFAPRGAVNFGISGDRTQHVLWRLENGNIEGITPKVAVLMIGTNNARANTSEQIAAGIEAIVKKLRQELPATKVLVLGIFPRGPDADDPLRKVNAGANELVKKLADDRHVFYLDIGPKFLTPEGVLEKRIMPDLLHLSPEGYEIWATSIEGKLRELLAMQ